MLHEANYYFEVPGRMDIQVTARVQEGMGREGWVSLTEGPRLSALSPCDCLPV